MTDEQAYRPARAVGRGHKSTIPLAERSRIAHQVYYAKNAQTCNERSAQYYEAHKEILQAKARARYDRKKEAKRQQFESPDRPVSPIADSILP